MDCVTQIYKEHQLVVELISGEVTVEELRDKFISLFSDPEYDSSMRGVCDLRNATSRINRTEFEQMAKELDRESDFGDTPWAIITDNPILTAFAHIFQRRVGEDGNIQVFSTLKSAGNHVGLPIWEIIQDDEIPSK